MKPITPIGFEYLLWKEGNKHMVRIISSGQTTEVNSDVFRFLRLEEKRKYRENMKESQGQSPLQTDDISADRFCHNSYERRNCYEFEDDVLFNLLCQCSCAQLTPNQQEAFIARAINNEPLAAYASRNGVSYQAVQSSMRCIRKKTKKFFKD